MLRTEIVLRALDMATAEGKRYIVNKNTPGWHIDPRYWAFNALLTEIHSAVQVGDLPPEVGEKIETLMRTLHMDIPWAKCEVYDEGVDDE